MTLGKVLVRGSFLDGLTFGKGLAKVNEAKISPMDEPWSNTVIELGENCQRGCQIACLTVQIYVNYPWGKEWADQALDR